MTFRKSGAETESLVTAAALSFAVGAALGWALSAGRTRRGREVRELVDELVRAAGDGLLRPSGRSAVLDQAVQRLRDLGQGVRDGRRS
jgi:hypothetical protein